MVKVPRRILTAAALALVTTVATVGIISSPASAAVSSCRIYPWDGEISCSTGTIAANSTYHAIMIMAESYDKPVTCRAHDAHNGIEVGQVTDTVKGFGTYKRIYGLYGYYFLVCVSQGHSEGEISNHNYWFD
jgi:hypothetical protein